MLPLRFARRLELSDCEEGKLHKFTHTWQFCNEVILHSLNYWTRTAQTDVCLWQSCACSTCSVLPPNANSVQLPQLYFIDAQCFMCVAIRDKLYFCERKKPANKFRIFLLQNVIWQEFKYFTFSLVSMIKSDVGN